MSLRVPLCKPPEAAQLMLTKYLRPVPLVARVQVVRCGGVTKLSGVPPYGLAEKWLTRSHPHGQAGEGGAYRLPADIPNRLQKMVNVLE